MKIYDAIREEVLKQAIELLKQELDWCERNKNNEQDKFQNGFIEGIGQSIDILNVFMFLKDSDSTRITIDME